MGDEVAEVGSVIANLVDHSLTEGVAFLRCPAAFDLGRAVLDEAADKVVAGCRQGRVPDRGLGQLDKGVIRPATLLPAIVGAFHSLHGVQELEGAVAQHMAGRQGRVVRHAGQGDVDLARGAPDLEIAGFPVQVFGDITLGHQAGKGALRVQVGHHDVSVNLITVVQRDTDGTLVFDDNLVNRGVGADLPPVFL